MVATPETSQSGGVFMEEKKNPRVVQCGLTGTTWEEEIPPPPTTQEEIIGV